MKGFSNACSPAKGITTKKRSKQKDNHSVSRLANDFFKTAFADSHCEELEKVQLQKAISALSERLLLF
jgi:hypothetical protein